MTQTLPLEFAYALDVGRARSNNEDSVALDPQARLAVLADGMGGYNAGEVASEMATSMVVKGLGEWLRRLPSPPTESLLHEAVEDWGRQANLAIHESSQRVPEHHGMGSTLLIAAFSGNVLVVGHVGDSRAYRFREGRLERLTKDHSLLQEQLDAGVLTPAQAATSTNRNLVTRALGAAPSVEVETHSHEVHAGDITLMCSDGVYELVDDQAMVRILDSASDLDAACKAIVDAANDAGGKDNISIVLIRAGNKPARGLRALWPFKR